MKKTVILSVLVCLLFGGCANGSMTEDSQTPTTSAASSNMQDKIALDAAEARAQYYQTLVVELQKEILSLKNEHASARVEYELRIEELEIALGVPQDAPPSDFRYTTKDGKITVTGYLGNEKIVSVPGEISGCPVTYIADTAFENHLNLEKVILPSSLEGIGWFAFRGCVALSEVEIPSSVSKIEYGAFENCNTKLTFVCPIGSYAEEYAQSYGYATKKL